MCSSLLLRHLLVLISLACKGKQCSAQLSASGCILALLTPSAGTGAAAAVQRVCDAARGPAEERQQQQRGLPVPARQAARRHGAALFLHFPLVLLLHDAASPVC